MMSEPIEVFRGTHRDPTVAFGPLPGRRQGNVVAYEFELPERFEPWPGRTRLERTFVLLDVGVSFSIPCWVRATNTDGSVSTMDPRGRDSWYVDLVTVETLGTRYTFRDLYIDAIVLRNETPMPIRITTILIGKYSFGILTSCGSISLSTRR